MSGFGHRPDILSVTNVIVVRRQGGGIFRSNDDGTRGWSTRSATNRSPAGAILFFQLVNRCLRARPDGAHLEPGRRALG